MDFSESLEQCGPSVTHIGYSEKRSQIQKEKVNDAETEESESETKQSMLEMKTQRCCSYAETVSICMAMKR